MNDDVTPSTTTAAPLTACPTCGCRDLFVRKDFPQRVGLAIVVVAAVAFVVLAASRRTFWVGVWVLAAAVVVDLVLYLLVGKVTVCYRCRAEFRDVPINPEHEGFELAVGEKYRQRPPNDGRAGVGGRDDHP